MSHPSKADALYDKGVELLQKGRTQAAAETFRKAVTRDPGNVYAHNGLGLALSNLGRYPAALKSFDTAIRLAATFASPYINRSLILRNTGQLKAALESLDKAVALAPDNPNGHGNRGSVLTELQRPAEAVASFDRALHLNPQYPLLSGLRLLNKLYMCDWTGIDREIASLLARIERGEPASPPWAMLILADAPVHQRRTAESWITANCPENPALGPLPKQRRPGRIRLGYYSSDFHRHATAYLISELFERHDRTKFELFAFSFGPETGDDMQKRITAASDHYIDVRAKGDADVAALSRQLGIDIAVDLKGITAGHRLGIFAHRAAPIQVNYLGWAGTMGAPYMDYILADQSIIPEAARAWYTEKVVTLPNSYQANDTKRKVSDRVFTRAELGLPETGVVFACFNNSFKILPEAFDVWMRILKAVNSSVLWLIEDNAAAVANLRREAERRAVDPSRVVFAPRIAPEEHLARHRMADLFLDTLPYNAHTTASDALWVGLPMITCPGRSFAARVGASLLKAVGLSELIVPTLRDYEALAIALATDPSRLRELRQRLEANRLTAPLFDAGTFTADIEAGYQRMQEGHPRTG